MTVSRNRRKKSSNELHTVTQTTVNKVVGDIKGLWSQALERVKQKVQQRLSGSSDSVVEDVMDCLEEYFPFDGLETEYLQRKYYKEHFDFVVSISILCMDLVINTTRQSIGLYEVALGCC